MVEAGGDEAGGNDGEEGDEQQQRSAGGGGLDGRTVEGSCIAAAVTAIWVNQPMTGSWRSEPPMLAPMSSMVREKLRVASWGVSTKAWRVCT